MNSAKNVVKEPCTAIWCGPPGVGKTKLVLDLLQNEYKKHFKNIVIICPTLECNDTYQEREFLWEDAYIFLIEPGGKLFDWIETLSSELTGEETLFIVDDIIADESLDKRRQPLLELAIKGRHRKHSLWLLTQSYTAIPKNLRRQVKMVFLWRPRNRSDLKIIDEETDLIDDWSTVKERLKASKHTCLYIRLEHPEGYKIIE